MYKTNRLGLAAGLGLGLVLRLALAWLPIQALVMRTLPDDAFIYFVIARHMSAGLGATFDGMLPTNGFHPLWVLILTPIFAVSASPDLPIHSALTLSAALDALTGLMIFFIARRITRDERAALVSALLYWLNGKMIFESVNGLETALANFMLALCFISFLNFRHQAPASQSQWVSERALIFGLGGGLMVLARTDLGIAFVLLWAALGAEMWRRSKTPRSETLIHLSLPLLSFGMVIAPWLLWSQWRVGTMIQSSAVAVPRLLYDDIQAGLTSGAAFADLWRELLLPILHLALRNALIYPGLAWLAVVFGLLARALAKGHPSETKDFKVLYLPLAGGAAIVLVHTFARWFPRGWYFAPLALGASLAAGPILIKGLEALNRKPAANRFAPAAVMALLLVISGLHLLKLWREPEYLWQADMRAGAIWLARHTPPGSVVGAFNPGLYAYFGNRTVINLDGLVDWEALRARERRALLDYLAARGGKYLIEHEVFLWDSFGDYLGEQDFPRLTQIVSIPPESDWRFGPVLVYQLKPQ